MKIKLVAILFTLAFLSGCVTTDVTSIPPKQEFTTFYIVENKKVKVDDFLSCLRDGFGSYGIKTKVVADYSEVPQGEYQVTYVAYRNWDIVPYLTDATITITKSGASLGQANYHLKAAGGLALSKFNGTKEKIIPLIDELLKNYEKQ